MRLVLTGLLAVLLTGCACNVCDVPEVPEPERFVAHLTGDQVVPPVDTDATGEFVMTADDQMYTLELTGFGLDPKEFAERSL